MAQNEYAGKPIASILVSVHDRLHMAIAHNATAERCAHSPQVVHEELNNSNAALRDTLTGLHELLMRLALPRTDNTQSQVTVSMWAAILVGFMFGATLRLALR